MGVIISNASINEQRRHSRYIEKILAEAKAIDSQVFKILLLGTGDSGKSTIVKQMRILHKNGFTKEELIQQRPFVIWNILNSISAILRAMIELGIDYGDPEREPDAEKILKTESEWHESGPGSLAFDDWTRIKKLWADAGVQACFNRSHEYQLSDSTKYFCDDLDRISDCEYIPTEQDLLRVRVPTTSIVEIDFSLRGLTVKIIDVGGQRSQRRKWIHCFENVNSLIFICAVSEYNQTLMEDQHVNRIQESLKLFGTIINCQWFMKSSIILFMNKKDLFEQKIIVHPLTVAFPEFSGRPVYDDAIEFVRDTFYKQKKDSRKPMYNHQTCATDTKNIEFVMDACFDTLLTRNIANAGIF